MKCTLIGCNENMSLSLCVRLPRSLFAIQRKIERQPNKIKNKEMKKKRREATAAIIITITRVRHRMWAKRQNLYAPPVLFLSRSPLRSFHFFLVSQSFSLYFVLTLCDSIRFYWFSALGGWNCT